MGFGAEDVEEFLRRCEKGDKSYVMKMIKKYGKDILKRTGAEYGQTPLHVCCENGRDELVQYLLGDRFSAQVNVHAIEKNGWTPLHAACKGGHLDIIEMLLRKGAVLRAVTNEGATPLHYFVRLSEGEDPVKHNRIMKSIMAGSFIDAENKHGQTPLHQAAGNSRFQNIIYLIQENADCNKQDRQGDTALHFASRVNNVESAKMLLQFSADPSIPNIEGKTPYSLVRKWDCPLRRSLIAWYRENGKEMPPEMLDDLEAQGEEVQRNPDGKGPKDHATRVASLKTVDSAPTSDVQAHRPLDRKRSSSVSTLLVPNLEGGARARPTTSGSHIEGTDIPGAGEESSGAQVNKRIENLFQRAAERETSKKRLSLADTKGPHSTSSTRVTTLVSNFEQMNTPPPDRKNEVTLARINRLKTNAADVVDVKSIEDTVAPPSDESLTPRTPERPSTGDASELKTSSGQVDSKGETKAEAATPERKIRLEISSFSDAQLVASLNEGWTCRVCNTKTQGKVPLVLGCSSPDEYQALEDKSRENSRLSADLCTVGKTKTFVRGLMEFPLRTVDEVIPQSKLVWSVWVAVSRSDFDKIVAGWNEKTSITVEGTIANNLPLYQDTCGASVTLTTRSERLRPLVSLVKANDATFLQNHREGMDLARLSELLTTVYQDDR